MKEHKTTQQSPSKQKKAQRAKAAHAAAMRVPAAYPKEDEQIDSQKT